MWFTLGLYSFVMVVGTLLVLDIIVPSVYFNDCPLLQDIVIIFIIASSLIIIYIIIDLTIRLLYNRKYRIFNYGLFICQILMICIFALLYSRRDDTNTEHWHKINTNSTIGPYCNDFAVNYMFFRTILSLGLTILMLIIAFINFVLFYCVCKVGGNKVHPNPNPNNDNNKDAVDAAILVIRGCHCCNFNFDGEFDANNKANNFVEIDLELQPIRRQNTQKTPKVVTTQCRTDC